MTEIGLEPTNFCIIREYAHTCDKATSDWRFVLMHVCDITNAHNWSRMSFFSSPFVISPFSKLFFLLVNINKILILMSNFNSLGRYFSHFLVFVLQPMIFLLFLALVFCFFHLFLIDLSLLLGVSEKHN